MKTILIPVLFCLCSALGLQARTQPAATRFAELPIDQVVARVKVNGDTVAIGTGRVLVALRLGSPNSVLPDGSWLYHGYSARPAPSSPARHGSLVIRFTRSEVTALTLADEPTVRALRAMPRSRAASR